MSFQASEIADELLAVHMLAVGLGGEEVGRIHPSSGHLGEELLDQGIDAAGAEHQFHRGDRPVEEQGTTTGEQCLASDFPHQTQIHQPMPFGP